MTDKNNDSGTPLARIFGPLVPLIEHGIKIIYLSLVVLVTSKLLHLILPTEYISGIERIEYIFYLAVTGLFCFYSFILLLFSLTAHLTAEISGKIKEMMVPRKKPNRRSSGNLLTEGDDNYEQSATPWRKFKEKLTR
jgi:hypothetical protein